MTQIIAPNHFIISKNHGKRIHKKTTAATISTTVNINIVHSRIFSKERLGSLNPFLLFFAPECPRLEAFLYHFCA